MSRVTRWKLEKAKVKVVFRLQFHATHVPQAGWDKLFISFIPADSVKATAKTTKALVRNGTCKWADPIYETTRLLQDTRTKQYEVVEIGSPRAKENATAALWHFCMLSPKFINSVLGEGVIPPLVALANSGTDRAKEKAQSLLEYFEAQKQRRA